MKIFKLQYHKIFVVYFCFIIGGSSGCTHFLSDLRPTNQLVTQEVFSDPASAEAAMVGIYTKQMTGWTSFFSRIGVVCALSADDVNLTNPSSSFTPFYENAIPIDDGTSLSLWRAGYQIVYQCNSLIENLAASPKLTSNVKNQLTGEAKFMRALGYFLLVNFFGDVPLTTSTDYTINASLERQPVERVYEQILVDLDEATQLLDNNYVSSERIRVNRGAAEALTARVHLYMGHWPEAVEAADAVIANSLYQLEPLEQAFAKESREIILGFSPASSQIFGTGDAYQYIPSSATAIPAYPLSQMLLESFEPGDNRKESWLATNVVGGDSYYYPFKYKVRSTTASTEKPEINIVLRLAEMYLIKAEALAQQQHVGEAIKALDKIRERASLPLIADIDPGINQASLLAKIYHERQVELFTEWGHRWFDLKRWGLADPVLSAIKSNWTTTAEKFPIPWKEIEVNHKLTQNDGYPENL